MLYIIINDLPECITKCDINLYADDTVIYYADKTAKEVEITLQNDIDIKFRIGWKKINYC